MTDINFGEDVQENSENVGGWSADDSGIQTVMFDLAYQTESKNGAYALNLNSKDKDGNERRYTIYFTNRNKEVFYIDKKTQEKKMLPGYQLINNLCLAACGKSFQEVVKASKKKVIDLYDFESRSDVPTEVTTYPAMCKKVLKIGVIKVSKNKFVKGKETNEKVEVNEIHTAFRKDDNLTPKEVKDKVKEAKAYPKWVKYWDGRVKDEFKAVEETEEESSGANPFGDGNDSTDDDLFGSDDTPKEEPTKTEEPSASDDEDEEDPFA